MAGKYQAYPEYKDPGIEWLGEVPKGWRIIPVKHLAELTPKKSLMDSSLMEKECSFLPMEKLKLNSIVLDEVRKVSDVYDGYTYFEDDDVLIAKVTPCFENKNMAVASGLTNGIGFGSSEIYVLRPYRQVNNRFLYYRLQEDSFMDIATAAMTGAGGLRRVPGDVVNTYLLATPEFAEQTQIANFLDHETAKIDTLIEEQQSLIRLLKEKRQAVISHAVTKGLNPDAPMKDSGVEWLGEVPEHWEVKRLKHVAEVVDCRNKTPEYFDDGEYFVVRTTNVKKQKLNFNGALYTNEKNFRIWTQRGVPPAGSILFTREAPAGEICLVPENLKFCLGQRMMNFISYEEEYKSFLFDFLLSDCLERYIESVSHGSTVTHLRVEQVENIPVIVPPKEEAKVIHEYLGRIKSKYHDLTQEAEQAIVLMQERRTALISAAVTGKIDVRGWTVLQPQNTQHSEPVEAV